MKLNDKKTYSQDESSRRLTRNMVSMIIALGMSTAILTGTAIADGDNGFPAKAHLPTDAKATCTANVASWFPSGHVIANGWVEPANSLSPVFADFKGNSRCDFYKWGAQMFLWLTSGSGRQHVFNSSPVFYNVSVKKQVKGKAQRTFLTGDGPMLLAVRKGKTDKEIELGQAGGGDVLLSQKKSLVYYGLHANDGFALYTTGQIKGAFDKSIWVEPKEDLACLKQFKNCAVEIKGYCKKQLATCTHNNFPSTPNQMDIVADFATGYGYPLWDKKAMAIELKTSWIDASTLSLQDRENYVLSQAVVPVLNRAATKGPWPVTGTAEKTLALVGMHVVGTVNGHPEMIWSTFEHVNNVPDNTYKYTSTTKPNPATQSYNSAGTWSFLTSGAAKPTAITSNGKITTANKNSSLPTGIVNTETKKAKQKNIGPIDIMRVDPWGNNHKSETASSIVSNNTDLVSINVSVLSQLAAGDIRGNYIQTGGIWTAKGQIPSDGTSKNLRGSLNLANTTMETFYQFQHTGKNPFNPVNCFGCHGSTYVYENPNNAGPTGVSHIFDALQPLPKK